MSCALATYQFFASSHQIYAFCSPCDSWAGIYKYFSSWHDINRGFKKRDRKKENFLPVSVLFLVAPKACLPGVIILANAHLPSRWCVTGPGADALQQVSLLSLRAAFQQVSRTGRSFKRFRHASRWFSHFLH